MKLPPFERVNDGSKYLQLIAGIQENRWKNEVDAEAEIYGKELNSKTFDMLKTRAKEHLVNMIFQLDTQKSFKSSYDRAYYKCCKHLLAGLLLINRFKLKAGENHLKSSLKLALQHQFTEFEIHCLRSLRTRATFSGDRKGFIKYSNSLDLKMLLLEKEQLVEFYDQDLILDILSSADVSTKFSLKAKKYFMDTEKIIQKYDSFNIRMNYYRLGFRYYNSIHQYHSTLKLAEQAINYLNENPKFKQNIRLGEFTLNKLHATQKLRAYKKGKSVVKECDALFNPGNLNWLIYLETYFLLCMQTHEYADANATFGKVISHSSFSSYPSDRIEKWKVYEAYLSYIYESAHNDNKKFNVYKFLNEVPIYSKDKTGYNVTILIAQILLLLKTSEYDKIISRAESLKMYVSRHVKRENSPRTYYFLKMLLVMIKYDFNPVKTEQIGEKFFDRMQENGANREMEEMEIIPYEILWPQVLGILEEQKHEHIFEVK